MIIVKYDSIIWQYDTTIFNYDWQNEKSDTRIV